MGLVVRMDASGANKHSKGHDVTFPIDILTY